MQQETESKSVLTPLCILVVHRSYIEVMGAWFLSFFRDYQHSLMRATAVLPSAHYLLGSDPTGTFACGHFSSIALFALTTTSFMQERLSKPTVPIIPLPRLTVHQICMAVFQTTVPQRTRRLPAKHGSTIARTVVHIPRP